MDILKIPPMEKREYDRLIEENCICRIAFRGDRYPYIAPFLYTFDKKYLHFLPTRYGRKIEYFRNDPSVSVEIERYSGDLSTYHFVSLQGDLREITDPEDSERVRQAFVAMIRKRKLSPQVMAALGYRPGDPPAKIVRENRNLVWRLVGVRDIVALKNA
ncbi:MAG: pyridoxamine 5'-phosphate oxidase family protein [Methanomicrobiales archaeon]|nr:pyridoxamine 5'-phosphate oxidase family protein [Methanomicrobiales archaeon]